MYISDKEQGLFKFTVDQKFGLPMYQQVNDIYPESIDLDDQLKTRVFNHNYTPRWVVALPEYPLQYYRWKRDQTCIFCGEIGKNCHNIRYGLYLSALTTRYFSENQDTNNEFDAVCHFHDAYRNIAGFEGFLKSNQILANLEDMLIPECMTFDSMVFALNSVEWNIMWGKNLSCLKQVQICEDSSNNGGDNLPHDDVGRIESGANEIELQNISVESTQSSDYQSESNVSE